MARQLSVLIKTFNEESKLADCLNSVLASVDEWDGEMEVIVADSRSIDGTLNVARNYPVGIVELAPTETRGCGIGVELGFQHAQCDYVLFLDGDMQLQPGFLAKAFDAISADPKVAGVAGTLEDTVVRNKFDHYRKIKKVSAIPGEQPWLSGGGLYRKSAISDAGGYAGNRNLSAYEEAELGFRLRSRGWKLLRLPISYVKHTGHNLTTFGLIRRMWMSGRIKAGGVLMRGAVGKPWFGRVVRMQVHPIAMLVLWATLVAALLLEFPSVCLVVLSILGLIFCAQALRRRSINDGFFSVLMWHVSAVGLLQGLFKTYVQPLSKVESTVLVPPRLLRAKLGESSDGLLN